MSADELKKTAASARRLATGIEAFGKRQDFAGKLKASDKAALQRAAAILRAHGNAIEGQSHAAKAKEKLFDNRLREATAKLRLAFKDHFSAHDAIVLTVMAGNSYRLEYDMQKKVLDPAKAWNRPLGHHAKRYVEDLITEAITDIAYRLAGSDDPLKTGGDIEAAVAKVLVHFADKRESILLRFDEHLRSIETALATPENPA